jgi:outer membrane protein TolC
MAGLEVTKDMRARIRAQGALLLAIGLVSGSAVLGQEQQTTLQLSLDEAVKRALENNADIVVARYNPELSAQAVRSAEGYYDPFVFGNVRHNSSDQKSTNAFTGGATVNTKTDFWNFGVSVPFQTGSSFAVTFNNNRADTNSVFASFNPTFNSSLSLSLTQPLLQNFKIDAPREQLKLAKKSREISDVQFRQQIINTVAGVKGFYYELIYSIDNLEAARQSLALAQKLLDENEIRVKVGTMAPLDVVSAQSEVASREVDVITAENALAQAEDNLKQAIFPKNDPAMWAIHITPTDRASAEAIPVDIEGAVRTALENRTDIVAARKSLEQADISLAFSRNQLLPQLNLVANWGAAGAGGTELIRDPPFGGPVVSTIPGGYGDALSEVFGADFPTWTVGVTFSYSIPNRTLKAQDAQARLTKEQTLASFRRLELQVAAEVRTAARGVLSGFKTVDSTKAARVLAEQSLDAEEKKFQAGMSTNYLVTQKQRDLAVAKVAELRAIANYRESVINLQRVQEAGLSTSGAVTLLSTGGSFQATQALRSGAAAAATTGQ